MATPFEQLVITIEADGARQAQADVDSVTASVDKAEKGATAYSVALLAVASAAISAVSRLKQLAETAAKISGVTVAAQFLDQSAALEAVTGSATRAQRAMSAFKDLELRQAFDAGELSKFYAQLVNVGEGTGKAIDQVKTLTNLAALSRVPGANQSDIIESAIGLRGREEVRKRSLQNLATQTNLGKVVAAGLGKSQPMTATNAIRTLSSVSGERAYQILIKGADALDKNAAAMQALRSPTLALTLALRTVQQIMEPTGELLIGVLMPVASAFQWVADAAVQINRASGGSLGLLVLMRLTAVGFSMAAQRANALKTGIAQVTETTTLLVPTLERLCVVLDLLAASATIAAQRTGVQAAANTAAGASSGISAGVNAAAAVPAVAAAGRFAALRAGAATALRAIGPRLLKGAGIGLGIDAATSIGASVVRGDGKNASRNTAADYIGGIGQGAAVGAAIGTVVPVIGTAVGAAVGAAIGGLKTAYDEAHKTPGSADDDTAGNTSQIVDVLKDIKAQLIGGGDRSRRVTGSIEAEFQIARALGAKIG